MKWVEDAFYLRLPSGLPMQGDIWCNLPMPYGTPSPSNGIIITPRCDLVNDKTPFLNYVPLLTVTEFLNAYGGFTLLERELYRAIEALRNAAEPLRVREMVDLQIPIETILADMESDRERKAALLNVTPQRLEKYLTVFRECNARVDRIKKHLKKPRLSLTDISEFVHQKTVAAYKLEMAQNRIADLHFLPPCPPLLEQPCVATFRHIVTCGIDFLREAQFCMSQHDWDILREQKIRPDFAGSHSKPERLLRLKTPFLESLMFRLGTLFGRVGVREIDRHQLEGFLDI